MISKVSKSITTALLLVVGFSSNSHCMNSMFFEHSMNFVKNINMQTDMLFNNMNTHFNNISKQMDMLFNNMRSQFDNINKQMDRLFNDVFTNKSNHMPSCFASWNTNRLNGFNSILYRTNIKPYVIQLRIEPRLNNTNRTQQIINQRSVQNSFKNNNAAYKPNNIVNFRQNNLRRRNYPSEQYTNVSSNNRYNHNNRQVQNILTYNNHINTIENHGHNVFSQILNNLEDKYEVDKNVKQFFNDYIGDNYNKIFHIFRTNNNQSLHNINLILLYNEVQNYLSIGSIKENLTRDIKLMHKLFFKGVQDPSDNRIKPAKKGTFKKNYLETMTDTIKIRTKQIEQIKYYINCTNADTQTKRNIKTLLNKCIQKREQYLNHILGKITSDKHLNNVYRDYLSYYKNNNEKIMNKNIPVL